MPAGLYCSPVRTRRSLHVFGGPAPTPSEWDIHVDTVTALSSITFAGEASKHMRLGEIRPMSGDEIGAMIVSVERPISAAAQPTGA
jgi:hypothetical protein